MNFTLVRELDPAIYTSLFDKAEYRFVQDGTIVSFSRTLGWKIQITTSTAYVEEILEKSNGRILAIFGNTRKVVNIIASGISTIRLDLDANEVPAGSVFKVAILKPAEFELWGGYSNRIIAPTGDLFPLKPYKKLMSFEIEPNPITGDYSFDVSELIQQYTRPHDAPKNGIDEALTVVFHLKYQNQVSTPFGILNVLDSSPHRFGYFGSSKDLTPFTKPGAPLCRNGAVNFIGEDGFALPSIFSTINTKYKSLNNSILKREVSIRDGEELGLLTGACYFVDVQLNSQSVEPRIADLPDWIEPQNMVPPYKTLRLKVCPPMLSDAKLGHFNRKHFNPAHFNVSLSVKGSYNLLITDDLDQQKRAEIKLNLSESTEIVRVPCGRPTISLAWLNLDGGWSSYIFTGVKDYGYEIGGEQTFVDGNGVLQTSEVEDVYEARTVRGSVMSRHSAIFTASLLLSPKVYEFNPETGAFDIPVKIDKQSFNYLKDKYRATENELSFDLIYSEKLKIQTV